MSLAAVSALPDENPHCSKLKAAIVAPLADDVTSSHQLPPSRALGGGGVHLVQDGDLEIRQSRRVTEREECAAVLERNRDDAGHSCKHLRLDDDEGARAREMHELSHVRPGLPSAPALPAQKALDELYDRPARIRVDALEHIENVLRQRKREHM